MRDALNSALDEEMERDENVSWLDCAHLLSFSLSYSLFLSFFFFPFLIYVAMGVILLVYYMYCLLI